MWSRVCRIVSEGKRWEMTRVSCDVEKTWRNGERRGQGENGWVDGWTTEINEWKDLLTFCWKTEELGVFCDRSTDAQTNRQCSPLQCSFDGRNRANDCNVATSIAHRVSVEDSHVYRSLQTTWPPTYAGKRPFHGLGSENSAGLIIVDLWQHKRRSAHEARLCERSGFLLEAYFFSLRVASNLGTVHSQGRSYQPELTRK